MSKSTLWMDSLKAHMELVDAHCGKIAGGESLEPAKLNEILDLFDSARNKFLLLCELHGLQTKPRK